MSPELTFTKIVGFRLVTRALERLTDFYRAIGFERGEARPISREEMAVLGLQGGGSRRTMILGPSRVDLDQFDRPGRAYPSQATACDPCFQHFALVTPDIGAAWRAALEAGAEPISRNGPVTLPKSAGGVTAVKFRDPEGHPLELLQFPQARCEDRGRSGMRIDHSAICVADLAASQSFYDHYGLREGERSLNHGREQVQLDGLDDIAVDVVPMNPPQMPTHLELLHYRRPAGVAGDAPRANDVAATRIVWRANREGLVRDPDGHLHQLTRPNRSPADIGSRR